MEEIILALHQMWGEFWDTSSLFEKILAIANELGAIYTFFISFILLHRIDSMEERVLSMSYILAKISLVSVMLGCFFAAIVVRVPDLHEFLLAMGITTLITHVYRMSNRTLTHK